MCGDANLDVRAVRACTCMRHACMHVCVDRVCGGGEGPTPWGGGFRATTILGFGSETTTTKISRGKRLTACCTQPSPDHQTWHYV